MKQNVAGILHFRRRSFLAAVCLALLLPSLAGAACTGLAIASSDSMGRPALGRSRWPSLSADGRYVAFQSAATNLVPNDTNGYTDVFVRDRVAGTTVRVSVSSTGAQGNGDSGTPSISADGRYVAFRSAASNLVTNDSNGVADIFVHDRQFAATTRISVSSTGVEANVDCLRPSISGDGRMVVFMAAPSSNLVPGNTIGCYSIVVHDRQTGQTVAVSAPSGTLQPLSGGSGPVISADGRYVAYTPNCTTNDGQILVRDLQTLTNTIVSLSSLDVRGNASSHLAAISANGRYVAYYSDATNLVSGDGNGRRDIFVRDRQAGLTTRVSVDSSGVEGNGASGPDSEDQPWFSISADGRFVSFPSDASNLVANDNNGVTDIFLHDRQTATTTRVSVPLAGGEADNTSKGAVISGDGLVVAFSSLAANLVSGDTNLSEDVFVFVFGAVGPSILQQPVGQSVCLGGAAQLTVSAQGTAPLTYQWRKGVTPIVNGGHYAGATTPILTISNVASNDLAADYNCLVSDTCGTAISTNTALAQRMCLLSVLQAGELRSLGPPGGPFEPSAITYTLRNASPNNPINYSVTSSAPWVSLNGAASVSGALAGGQMTDIVVAIGPGTNGLVLGRQDAVVTFEETTSPCRCAESRNVHLFIGNLAVTGVSTNAAPTTGRDGGNPITVRLVGTLLQTNAEVRFGDRLAMVTGSSTNLDYLDVTLPVYPPGCDCATQTNIPVAVTVTVGGRTVSAPQPFVYEIVRSRVPGNFPAIQPAINAALPGTCVVVAPGDYVNDNAGQPLVNFRPDDTPLDDITLAAETIDGESVTLWGATSFTPAQPVVVFDGNNDQTVLTGFEIILGNSGIVVRNGAQPMIKRNQIDNNFASGDGAGIRVTTASRPTILDNRISDNTALGSGGGISVRGATALISSNQVLNNLAAGAGGGVFLTEATAVVCRNFIEDNGAGGNGGGVFLHPSNSMELRGNTMIFNGAGGSGGGIYLDTDFPVTVIDNLVEGNEAKQQGGGLYFTSAQSGTPIQVTLNSFLSNSATNNGRGGGIYWTTMPRPTVVNNVISWNEVLGRAAQGGGVFMEEFARGELRENTLVGNRSQMGGAIALDRKADPDIVRNVIAFNVAEQTVHDAPAGPNPPPPPPYYGPGIYLNDAGPRIQNNTLHANTGGDQETGGIHALSPGVFRPRWFNNLFTANQNWGVFCETANGGVTIDFNGFFGNASGAMNPRCFIQGRTFQGNRFCDPQYLDPTAPRLDFRLAAGLCARDVGAPGTGLDPDGTPPDLGALVPDGRASAAGTQPAPILDTASSAAVAITAGGLPPGPPTEVLLLARNLGRDPIVDDPLTPRVWLALNPTPASPIQATLTLPLIKPASPGTLVQLAYFDPFTEAVNRTNVFGAVDAGGWLAVLTGPVAPGWLLALAAPPQLRIACFGGGTMISWSGTDYTVQEADNVLGPWRDLPGATSPFVVPAQPGVRFFRLRRND